MADDGADNSEELESKLEQSGVESNKNGLAASEGSETPVTEGHASSSKGCRKRSPPSTVSLDRGSLSSVDREPVTCSTPTHEEDKDSNSNTNNSNSDGDGLKPVETVLFGLMKKDDSGIDVEKSPTSVKDSSLPSDGEGNESISESLFTDSASGSRTNSMSEYKGKTTMDEDPSEVDDGAFSVDVVSKPDTQPPQSSSDVADSSVTVPAEANADSDNSSVNMRASVKRRGRRRSSSSDSDDDEGGNGEDSTEERKTKHKSSDSEEEDYSAFETPRILPKHRWRAVPELRCRELGHVNTLSSLLFQERITGCLRMVQRLELQTNLDYHEGCVNTLSFNRIGTLLASGSDDLNIVLWNWVKSKPVLIFDSGHRSNVFQAKFMPYSGDCHVISCARDGQVRLAELSLTGICKGTKKLAQHKGAAHKLALEYDSPYTFLTCGEDAVMLEIDLRDDKPNKLGTTKENDRKVALYSIHSNPANSFEYCVGGRDHFIRIYDKRRIDETVNGGVLKKYCPHHLLDSDLKANVTCACYNYNGSEVLGTFNDEDIYLFDNSHSDGADSIHRYKGHRNNATVKGVNFYGPKSEFVVSGSDCGHVFLWDKDTEEVVQFMQGDVGGVVNVLEPHPMAPILATSGLDHDIKIWAPTAAEATALKGLRKVMRKNRRDREDERSNEPEMIDGQMLWFLMHHLRRSARRRARQDGEHVSSSSDSSDMESEEDEETPDRMQCAPS